MSMSLYASGGSPVTVRECDAGYTVTYQSIGNVVRTISGAMIRHVIAGKVVIQCTWSHLSSSELSILWAEIVRTVALKITLPDTSSYTVYSISPEQMPTEFGTTVRGRFEEV